MWSPGSANTTQTRLPTPSFVRLPFTTARNTTTNWPAGKGPLGVVLRLVRNPEGYLSETDGDYTYMLRQDLASGKLDLLPEDWETLGRLRRDRLLRIVTHVRSLLITGIRV
jgi:Phage protein Gp19/Gp15/Gp42